MCYYHNILSSVSVLELPALELAAEIAIVIIIHIINECIVYLSSVVMVD